MSITRTMEVNQNREAWLETAVEAFRKSIEHACGAEMPAVRVSVGFPSTRGLSTKKRRIGECWHKDISTKDNAHIFVSPLIEDSIEVLGVLLHELCHATLPYKTGHRKAFSQAVKALGLEGKPTATHCGEELTRRLNAEFLPHLGPYPHKAWIPLTKEKKGSRLRLWQCSCPVKVRVASDNFDATCNICEEKFEQ